MKYMHKEIFFKTGEKRFDTGVMIKEVPSHEVTEGRW